MNLFRKILLTLLVVPTAFFAASTKQAEASTTKPITLQACYAQRHETFGTIKQRAAVAAKHGIWQYRGTKEQNSQLSAILCPGKDVLGYSVVTDYQKGLSAPMTSSQSFVPVTSLTLRDGSTFDISDLGGKVFLTIEPGTSKEEIVLCTSITTTTLRFSSCTRGLAFKGSSVSSVTANAFTHNAGSTVVISNVHYVYQQFLDITGGSQTVNGLKTFTTYPVITTSTSLCSSNGEFCTKYYVDNVGAGGFTAANVSTTRGLSVDGSVPERVGINASTTAGIAFDSSGKLYISTSSTGGINFASGGQIQVDGSDNFNFSGTVTSTGKIDVPTPTLSTNATNKLYTDNRIATFTATGTAATTITAGQALYATATSTVGVTDTTTGTSTYAFIGFAISSAANGAEVSYTRPGGINCAQTGLVPGTIYYLSGTGGAISTTAGAAIARIGTALSTTCIQVSEPKFIAYGTISLSAVAGGSTNVTTVNFFPANVRFKFSGVTGLVQSGVGIGWGVSDDAGVLSLSTGTSFPDRSSNAAGSVYSVRDSSDVWHGTITKSSTGFTITNVHDSGAGTLTLYLQYTVESL